MADTGEPGLEGKVSAFDALAVPTHDERARQQFVSGLRKHIIGGHGCRNAPKEYPERVLPKFRAAHQPRPA